MERASRETGGSGTGRRRGKGESSSSGVSPLALRAGSASKVDHSRTWFRKKRKFGLSLAENEIGWVIVLER